MLSDFDPEKLLNLVKNCIDCKTERRDPFPEELFLYLHAFEYKGENWKYTSAVPEWANSEFVEAPYFQLEEQIKHFQTWLGPLSQKSGVIHIDAFTEPHRPIGVLNGRIVRVHQEPAKPSGRYLWKMACLATQWRFRSYTFFWCQRMFCVTKTACASRTTSVILTSRVPGVAAEGCTKHQPVSNDFSVFAHLANTPEVQQGLLQSSECQEGDKAWACKKQSQVWAEDGALNSHQFRVFLLFSTSLSSLSELWAEQCHFHSSISSKPCFSPFFLTPLLLKFGPFSSVLTLSKEQHQQLMEKQKKEKIEKKLEREVARNAAVEAHRRETQQSQQQTMTQEWDILQSKYR